MADIGELVIQIQASAEGLEAVLNGVTQSIQRFAAQAETGANNISLAPVEKNVQSLGEATEDKGKKMEAAWNNLGKAAASALGDMMQAVNQGITAYQEYQSAMQGVRNAAAQNGVPFQAMQAELGKVTDAFLDTSAATTAYNNLLARGFTLDQATDTILRLKEAAALGRQSNQSFAQAVVSATEGIKSENSALVENAGVTKGVAKMWQEYAAARGLVTHELTQGQKAEAEYLGIMQATLGQVGDLSKLSGTLAGSQAEAAQQSKLLAESFGEAMTPVVQAGTDIFTGILSGLTGVAAAAPGVTAGITGAAGAFAALVTAASGIQKVSKLFSDLNTLKNITTPLGAVAAVVGLLAGAYTGLKHIQEEMARAEEERIAANKEAVVQQQGRLERLEQLTKRYQELSGKSNLNYADQRELVSIQSELASAYGVTATSLDGATKSAQEYLTTLQLLHQQELKELQVKQKQASQDAYVAAKSAEYVEQQKKILDLQGQINGKKTELAKVQNHEMQGNADDIQAGISTLEKALQNEKATLAKYGGLFAKWFHAAVSENLTAAAVDGKTVNTAMADVLKGLFEIDLSKFNGDTQAADAWVDGIVANVVQACSATDTSAALTAITGVMDKIKAGTQPSEKDVETFSQSWDQLVGAESPLLGFITQLQDATDEPLQDVTAEVMALILGLEGMADAQTLLADTSDDLGIKLEKMADYYAMQGSELRKAVSDLETNKLGEYGAALLDLDSRLGKLSGQKKALDTMKALAKQYKEGISAGKDMSKTQGQLQTAAKAAGAALKVEKGQITNLDEAIEGAEESMNAAAAGMVSDLEGVIASLEAEKLALEKTDGKSINVNTGPAIASINAAIKVAQFLLSLLGGMGIATDAPPKGGGGGGGKKNKAEEARKAAEEARRRPSARTTTCWTTKST